METEGVTILEPSRVENLPPPPKQISAYLAGHLPIYLIINTLSNIVSTPQKYKKFCIYTNPLLPGGRCRENTIIKIGN
jgi:hypothetical protein